MATHNDFGKEAEQKAINYLREKGYSIIETNFRYNKAELDIIARFENLIVVVEVKARTTNHFIEPYEAVNKKKIRLILMATEYYLELLDEDIEVRFDIISIVKRGSTLEISHIENAFEAFDAN